MNWRDVVVQWGGVFSVQLVHPKRFTMRYVLIAQLRVCTNPVHTRLPRNTLEGKVFWFPGHLLSLFMDVPYQVHRLIACVCNWLLM